MVSELKQYLLVTTGVQIGHETDFKNALRAYWAEKSLANVKLDGLQFDKSVSSILAV